jgi:hypothetical protein
MDYVRAGGRAGLGGKGINAGDGMRGVKPEGVTMALERRRVVKAEVLVVMKTEMIGSSVGVGVGRRRDGRLL